MSVLDIDIKFYKSIQDQSTGGAISATEISDATVQNLFASVTPAQALAGITDYRKFFIKNISASIWYNVAAWLSSQTASPDDSVLMGIGSPTDTDGSNALIRMTQNSVISVASDNVDTREVTLVGEDVDGNPVTETLSFVTSNPIAGAQVFSRLYNAYVLSNSGVNTITITQVTGSTILGTIGPALYSAILYFDPTTKAVGYELDDLDTNETCGVWIKRTVTAGSDPYQNNIFVVQVEGETT